MVNTRSSVMSTDPLALNPSDNINSIAVQEKLVGIANYRSWRRDLEIQLASRRKLGFVTGTVTRDVADAAKQEMWDTCNSMVIAWITNSVSENIKKSILFLNSAAEIWNQLEKRFYLSNGARKYQLNKDIYNLKQNNMTVTEYYTKLRTVWEELDAMNTLPSLSTITDEIKIFLAAIEKQKEEQRLFQFLFGLDEDYKDNRSQLLMLNPLPSIDTACSVIQQEETQREVNVGYKPSSEVSAFYGKGPMSTIYNRNNDGFRGDGYKGTDLKCTACGNKGHSKSRCWTEIGYPHWHPRSKQFPQKVGKIKDSGRDNGKSQLVNKGKGGMYHGYNKTAAHVTVNGENGDDGHLPYLTQQQINQLLKLLPSTSGTKSVREACETDDELEVGFAGLCHKEA